MGHEIRVKSFECKDTKEERKNIFDIMNRLHRRCCEYHTDLDSLEFIDKTFDSYEEAEEYLYNHEGFYWQGAVRYRVHEQVRTAVYDRAMKKLGEHKEKVRAEEDKFYAYIDRNDLVNRKTTYVGCDGCGSKLNKGYIRRTIPYSSKDFCYNSGDPLKYAQKCNLCGHILASDTVIKGLQSRAKALDSLIDLERQLLREVEKSKRGKSYKLYWLVKIEYHV